MQELSIPGSYPHTSEQEVSARTARALFEHGNSSIHAMVIVSGGKVDGRTYPVRAHIYVRSEAGVHHINSLIRDITCGTIQAKML